MVTADRRTYSGGSIKNWRVEDENGLNSIEPTAMSSKEASKAAVAKAVEGMKIVAAVEQVWGRKPGHT